MHPCMCMRRCACVSVSACVPVCAPVHVPAHMAVRVRASASRRARMHPCPWRGCVCAPKQPVLHAGVPLKPEPPYISAQAELEVCHMGVARRGRSPKASGQSQVRVGARESCVLARPTARRRTCTWGARIASQWRASVCALHMASGPGLEPSRTRGGAHRACSCVFVAEAVWLHGCHPG